MSIRPTRVEIDLEALRHNVRLMQQTAKDAQVLAVVKANAYGHGAVPCTKAALEAGACMLAVALVEEGIELREAGIDAPILMLGQTDSKGAFAAAEYGIATVVFTEDTLLALEGAAKSLGVTAQAHIKLDTGMNRIGVRTKEELEHLLDVAAQCKHVHIAGAMTHFATADVPESDFGLVQIGRYEEMLAVLSARGIRAVRHAAASAAAERYEQAQYDMVRAGIMMYGCDEMHVLPVKPVMRWVTKVVYVKTIPAGETVSYGRRFTAQKETVIATIPVGYADGYKRAFTNKAQVLVHNRRVNVAGTVCMDQVMLDVTGLDVKAGDEVVLLGCQGEEEITAQELADIAGTISYEIFTGVSARVPRVFLHE